MAIGALDVTDKAGDQGAAPGGFIPLFKADVQLILSHFLAISESRGQGRGGGSVPR